MEELAETLAINFQVSEIPNNPNAPHPHFSLYKTKGKNLNQDTRRKNYLDEQKKQRSSHVNQIRNIIEKDPTEENPEELKEDCELSDSKPRPQKRKQPCTTPTETCSKYQRIIKILPYKNQLMLSEWLVDIPEDLNTNWYFMPCPVGKRCLVVTTKGMTTAYTRSGYFLKQFSSYLPGGSKQQQQKNRSAITMLDCVFSEAERTFYILDIMCWNGHPVIDSETEFRFYWLREKLSEISNISAHSAVNPYRFIRLQFYDHSDAELNNILTSPLTFPVPLDGILFYHKHTHYTRGHTPLVNWLKAYMVPAILNIEVSEEYLKEAPPDYTGGVYQVKKGCKKKKCETPPK